MRALIVDDEPTVRLLLSRILRREVHCTVTEAANGIEALDLLARQPFDFVVIDVMMPMMDGLETLEVIRSTPALRHLPVMVLSAVRDELQVRQLIALGISAYLTKPLRPSDAAARVQRFVASLGPTAPVAASGLLQDGPDLRPHMISATEQVFGMMLGIEVFADPVRPSGAAAGVDLVRVRMSMPAAPADLEFGIATAREMGKRLTALCLQDADVVTEGDVCSTLQEVANIISSRLQGALRGRQHLVTIGLPAMTTLTEDVALDDAWLSVGFHNAAGDIRVATFVRQVDRSPTRGHPGARRLEAPQASVEGGPDGADSEPVKAGAAPALRRRGAGRAVRVAPPSSVTQDAH